MSKREKWIERLVEKVEANEEEGRRTEEVELEDGIWGSVDFEREVEDEEDIGGRDEYGNYERVYTRVWETVRVLKAEIYNEFTDLTEDVTREVEEAMA